VPGAPALTVNSSGAGTAWYLAARLDPGATATLVRHLCHAAGVEVHEQPGVETVRRYGAQASYLFVLNHTDQPAKVDASGTDLLTGTTCTGTVEVPAGGVAVIREEGA